MAEEKKLKSKDLTPRDGVVKREDQGDFEVIRGARGEVTVLPKEGVTMTDELRQAIVDKSIELSATPVAEDVRHSEHPEFATADGTRVNGEEAATARATSEDPAGKNL